MTRTTVFNLGRLLLLSLGIVALGCNDDGESNGAAKQCFADDCGTCLKDQCSAELSACFGEGHVGGVWAGDCAAFGECAVAEDCCADDVSGNCGVACSSQATSSCVGCLGALDTCEDTNCAAACLSGPATGGACQVLDNCCSTLPQGQQGACGPVAAAGVDSACQSLIDSLQLSGQCL